MMSLRSALRPAISRCTQNNSIISLASRDMTVLSKKSGEEYNKQVSGYKTTVYKTSLIIANTE
jgi:hypothetical protein